MISLPIRTPVRIALILGVVAVVTAAYEPAPSGRRAVGPAQSQDNPLRLSANPVRQPPLVFRWPAGTGSARVQVYSFLGTLVAEADLSPDPGLYRWDLTVLGGALAANGAYVVVVTRSDGLRYRRRFFVSRTGAAP